MLGIRSKEEKETMTRILEVKAPGTVHCLYIYQIFVPLVYSRRGIRGAQSQENAIIMRSHSRVDLE